ncbi:ATP-binding protein [Nesterenkonia muleiensis]|uniref:ATP-binding protein n=1 Tax=Nesterenkonia muleiensis TaxID=2282648 RepID=UPI000E70BDB1|nr:AAA family ATPase [Nesterenkonia muleiensis]
MKYIRRVFDDELDALLPHIPAIAIDGPKFVGKTTTALQHAHSSISLDDPTVQQAAAEAPHVMLRGKKPLLIDEWQKAPPIWDAVRRAVDAHDGEGGQFLLTGSANPAPGATAHSGAGRIVRMRMRPMALSERGVGEPTVSLRELLYQAPAAIDGYSEVDFEQYVTETIASGIPNFRGLNRRNLVLRLDSYLENLVERDIQEFGQTVRRRALLMDWLRAYASASGTTASFKAILERATPGEPDKPAHETVTRYRELLRQIWILDPIDAWNPRTADLGRLSTSPKHHLADPAFAARLLGLTAAKLMRGDTPRITPPYGTIAGNLFESLAALCTRVYAQAAEADVYHLRTRNGDHEADLIVEGYDGSVVAIEVKLSGRVSREDLKHLHWLKTKLGNRLTDAIIITTGPAAYRRDDGIGVVPLALLGL